MTGLIYRAHLFARIKLLSTNEFVLEVIHFRPCAATNEAAIQPFGNMLLRLLVDRGVVDLNGLTAQEWRESRAELHRRGERFFEQKYANGRWMRISERKTPDGGTVGVFAERR